jgi:hypothetical protein
MAGGMAVVGTMGSSRAGGSTSPKAMANIAEGTNIGGQRQMRQRVEDNAFHVKIAPWVFEHTANGQRAEFQTDVSSGFGLER